MRHLEKSMNQWRYRYLQNRSLFILPMTCILSGIQQYLLYESASEEHTKPVILVFIIINALFLLFLVYILTTHTQNKSIGIEESTLLLRICYITVFIYHWGLYQTSKIFSKSDHPTVNPYVLVGIMILSICMYENLGLQVRQIYY